MNQTIRDAQAIEATAKFLTTRGLAQRNIMGGSVGARKAFRNVLILRALYVGTGSDDLAAEDRKRAPKMPFEKLQKFVNNTFIETTGKNEDEILKSAATNLDTNLRKSESCIHRAMLRRK